MISSPKDDAVFSYPKLVLNSPTVCIHTIPVLVTMWCTYNINVVLFGRTLANLTIFCLELKPYLQMAEGRIEPAKKYHIFVQDIVGDLVS